MVTPTPPISDEQLLQRFAEDPRTVSEELFRRHSEAAMRAARAAGSDEADAEDARWLEHDYVTHVSERAHAWVDEQEGWTYVWQEECRAFDAPVLVSEEQMSALRSEMEALLGRYRRMGAGTPGARRVAVTVIPLPLPPS